VKTTGIETTIGAVGEVRPDRALWSAVCKASGPVAEADHQRWLRGLGGSFRSPAPVPAPPVQASPPAERRFYPWWCQERAAASRGPERRLWLDRALDAFAEIADAPTDVGNDEGPLWAVARWFDRDQVHRGFALLESMAPFDWPYRLGGSRAALIGRLAELGELDAAWEQLEGFSPNDSFSDHWCAVALGRWLAAATHRGLTLASGLHRVGFSQLSPAQRYVLLDEVWHSPAFRPRPGDARSWLDLARGLEDSTERSLSVRYLAASAWPALPAVEWIDAVTAEREAAAGLLELVDVGGAEVLAALEALLRFEPRGELFPELLEHPDAELSVVEACGRRWLRGGPSRFDLDPAALRCWLERAGVGPHDEV